MHVHVQLCGSNQRSLLPANYLFFQSKFAPAMSQNQKDKAKGSEDVHEEESAAASPNRSSTWMCDDCKKEKDIKQIACFWNEKFRPVPLFAVSALKRTSKRTKKKKAKEKENDASMKKRRMEARIVTESFACLVQFY